MPFGIRRKQKSKTSHLEKLPGRQKVMGGGYAYKYDYWDRNGKRHPIDVAVRPNGKAEAYDPSLWPLKFYKFDAGKSGTKALRKNLLRTLKQKIDGVDSSNRSTARSHSAMSDRDKTPPIFKSRKPRSRRQRPF